MSKTIFKLYDGSVFYVTNATLDTITRTVTPNDGPYAIKVSNYVTQFPVTVGDAKYTLLPLLHEACSSGGYYYRTALEFSVGRTSILDFVYRVSVLRIKSPNDFTTGFYNKSKNEIRQFLGDYSEYSLDSTSLNNTDEFIISNIDSKCVVCRYGENGWEKPGASSGVNWYADNDTCSQTLTPFLQSWYGTEYGLIGNYIPNQGGGTSSPGAGAGRFDKGTDVVPSFDGTQLASVLSCGFISAYSPNIAQLNSLANYMWTDDQIYQLLRKLFADPMDAIISLGIVPCTPVTDGSQVVKLGNVSTGISMPRISTQFASFTLGSIEIAPYWDSALDYAPYTSISLYLPFIGSIPLDTDKVMGCTLTLNYRIDVLTGACAAQLIATGPQYKDQTTGEQRSCAIGNWQGSCRIDVPITANNYAQMAGAIATSAVTGIGTAVAMGAVGGPGGALLGVGSAVAGLASSVMNNKPHVEMSGSVTGAGGYMSCRQPYVTITRPHQCLADSYNEMEGYPANITYKMSELSGYTVISSVHLDNVTATSTELEEIENLLKGGVIF